LSNVTYWAGHRQAGAPMTNIQSTLRTATDLRQNVLLALLFGRNSNSYIYEGWNFNSGNYLFTTDTK